MNITYSGLLDMRGMLPAVRRDGLLVMDASGRMDLRHSGAAREVVREQIARLKDYFLLIGQPLDLPVHESIVDGMYMRRLTIPAGALVVGKIHRKACFNIVAAGEITVLTEFGCRRTVAGETAVSLPGTQKVGLAHTDTVFVNVFRTDAKSVAEVEDELTCERLEML
jgi:hypothetical protein